jgi:hypothetical protein
MHKEENGIMSVGVGIHQNNRTVISQTSQDSVPHQLEDKKKIRPAK